MTGRCSIADTRRRPLAPVREAEAGGAVELTRRSKAVAVSGGFVATWREFLRDAALAELAFDPDDLFVGARDPAPGREVRM